MAGMKESRLNHCDVRIDTTRVVLRTARLEAAMETGGGAVVLTARRGAGVRSRCVDRWIEPQQTPTVTGSKPAGGSTAAKGGNTQALGHVATTLCNAGGDMVVVQSHEAVRIVGSGQVGAGYNRQRHGRKSGQSKLLRGRRCGRAAALVLMLLMIVKAKCRAVGRRIRAPTRPRDTGQGQLRLCSFAIRR